ncbi:2-amino-4-hydroxy-6-hydroxymethyldihydropteridine diphosphokinase [Spirochaetia bacterium]|nr:2-amino-4-hydroxy-6-hydroxymethyldihydropteridine diphosphokinase [Spirochaetia bacterium]
MVIPVVLGLGSNKGDSRSILEGAVEVLQRDVLKNLRCSNFIETEPMGLKDQRWFLNAAVAGDFSQGGPHDLLDLIHRIEATFGRDRSKERRWGERTLDIDILLFGSLIVSEPPVLEIPHPRLRERPFALIPLLQLLPDAVDPSTGESYKTVLERLHHCVYHISDYL